jgi:hypothetical protein
MLYAVDVWGNPFRTSSSRRKGLAKVIKQLMSVQRTGVLAITGRLRTSPTDALDAATFLLPLALTVERWRHRALVWLVTLPEGHLLHKIMKHKNMKKIKRHKSPINSLMNMSNINPRNVEKAPTATRHPMQTGELPFIICIPNSREGSVAEAQNASEEIQIFTDGSATNGRVGAVLTRRGKEPHTLHLHLGPDKEHTVQEAELVRIMLGLYLLKTEK